MSETLEDTIRETLINAYADNEDRRDNVEDSLAAWGQAHSVAAPLSMSELYVACRRCHPDATRQSVERTLLSASTWTSNGDDVDAGGPCRFYGIAVNSQDAFVLRFGREPSNGILTACSPDELGALAPKGDVGKQSAPSGLFGRLFGRQIDRINDRKYDTYIEEAILEAHAEDEPFHAEAIAERIGSRLGGRLGNPDDQGRYPLQGIVESRLTDWTHTLFLISIQSTLGDIDAHSIIKLPSEKIVQARQADSDAAYAVAVYDTLDKEAIFESIVEELCSGFEEDGVLEGADMVILGQTLLNEEAYPVDDMEFWRDLLGYPYIFDEL